MIDTYSMTVLLVLLLPCVILVGLGCVPARVANASSSRITTGATLALLVAIVGLVCLSLLTLGGVDLTASSSSSGWADKILYVDGLSLTMAIMIACLGLVILRFSDRYMQGSDRHGTFMQWTAFTLGSVLLFVLSGNLLSMVAAWMLTSFGLHQLLTHSPNSLVGRVAVRKKFLISRLGDAFLVVGTVLTYAKFGSVAFADVFYQLDTLRDSVAEGGPRWDAMMVAICVTFVLGAMTKSAQFPFHTWLPDTLDAPTPVSALMHAGIINAGGFLVLRLSPLISLSLLSMALLAIVGGLTACCAAFVALTQPSLKRGLGYSTVAQMGFMMLQCGLGAFPAALLHIVAHSCYKAHAFLNSGAAVESIGRPGTGQLKPYLAQRSVVLPSSLALPASLLISGGVVALALLTFGMTGKLTTAPLSLILVLGLALAQVLHQFLQVGTVRTLLLGTTVGLGVAFGYCGLYLVFEKILAGNTIAAAPALAGPWMAILLGLVAALGLLVFVQAASRREHLPVWLQRLYVHSQNGFYIDLWLGKSGVFQWHKC